ncbi:LysR family transcriptional regulator [Marinobacterium lutimaris]|uniref:Transcriptional regulator, LysR family n=1 Tax=Marinobacterium lutimaris TaxID=568106 RepID=A0A1H6AKY8_9GAMM|nr:LysR family transcriptional regulator [Marinobacterium lutimaris]SEG48747.1 transcriptional regulator, LysR family [Marinobacterium lutimaris]
MELRQLQYFTVIYDEGSLTRAAQRLNVVQPALSQQLSKLEEELGRPLFLRTPKGMIPTEAGIQAYPLFAGVLSDIKSAKQQIEENSSKVQGNVSIGVVHTVSHNVLADTLVSYHQKYPDVQVRATGGYTTDLTEMLRTSQLDLIVINAPPQARNPDMIDIICEDLVLVGAADTPLPLPVPVDYASVNQLKLVIPSPRHGLRYIMDSAASKLDFALSPRMEFDDLKPIEDFVGHSDFFTILPPLTVHRELRAGRLKAYPIASSIPRRLIYMSSKNRPLSHAAELLIEEIRERMIDVSHEISASLDMG